MTDLTFNNTNYSTAVGSSPFAGSGIQRIFCEHTRVIPEGIFRNCGSLQSIQIYPTMDRIGADAFYGCTNLNEVYFRNRDELAQKWHTITFGNEYANPLYYAHKLRSYNDDPSDGYVAFSEVYCNSNYPVKDYAYVNCTTVTKVIIMSNCPSIGTKTFSGCTNLTEVESTSSRLRSLTTLGQDAFSGCTSLQKVSIPWSVTTIGANAFRDCTSLAEIEQPNNSELATIGGRAFENCTSLTSFTVPGSITSIGTDAFNGCSSLKTVFNLSALSITPGADTYGKVARNAVRVATCTNHGTGDNAIHEIPEGFNFVANETDGSGDIPESTIPDNFIYKVGSNAKTATEWKAKRVVLVDGDKTFSAPYAFTADEAVYTRDFRDGNRSTLCLPFNAEKPAGLDVYTFADYNSSTQTIRFQELQGNELTAYTPYLVGYGISQAKTNCEIIKENALFPATPTPIATSTINGLTFLGTMERECMNSTNYGYKDGYFVQSSNGNNEDPADHAHVNPFRCYFTLSGNQSAPQTLSVDTDGDYLGIEDVDGDMEQSSIRYSNDVYDMMGRLVRKDAESLRGLPKGIYIWRGKKQLAF
ncbi:MAG: leucine-rich repeat domain-containing protein [Bacteroidales bacterium]|nr:leucine-rich repeat domain-containing protein [Bacteroidales bacterium]